MKAENYKLNLFEKLFKKDPTQTGVFSTRAPVCPNPIGVSTMKVVRIDFEKGIIYTSFIDAEPGHRFPISNPVIPWNG